MTRAEVKANLVRAAEISSSVAGTMHLVIESGRGLSPALLKSCIHQLISAAGVLRQIQESTKSLKDTSGE